LTWRWRYHDPPRVLAFDPAPGDRGRDAAREAALVAAVEQVWPGGTDLAARELTGVATAEFTAQILPELERLPGVAVETTGRRPEYEELTGAPHVTVTTVETDRTDWFDLGFIVRIEGREIPFTRLFEALSRGKKKLLLVDRTYFSLDHPAFDRLRELLGRAQELPEWEPARPRLSRYQVD